MWGVLWVSFHLLDPRLGAEEAPNPETPRCRPKKSPKEQLHSSQTPRTIVPHPSTATGRGLGGSRCPCWPGCGDSPLDPARRGQAWPRGSGDHPGRLTSSPAVTELCPPKLTCLSPNWNAKWYNRSGKERDSFFKHETYTYPRTPKPPSWACTPEEGAYLHPNTMHG